MTDLPCYLQQGGHKKYGKTKKMSYLFYDSLSFFVEEPPLYLQQGGCKTAFVKNIYRRLRLREHQTVKAKIWYPPPPQKSQNVMMLFFEINET